MAALNTVVYYAALRGIDFLSGCETVTTPTFSPEKVTPPSAVPQKEDNPARALTPTISTTPSTSPSISFSPSATSTPSASISASVEPTSTPTPSSKPAHSRSPTRTPSSFPSGTVLPTVSGTPTSSPTVSITPSVTPTMSITPPALPTSSVNLSPSPTSSTTPSVTSTMSVSPTPSTTPSVTPTMVPSTPSATPSASLIPTASPTTPSQSRTPSPSSSTTPSNSGTPSISVSASSSATSTPSASPSSSVSASVKPTSTPSRTPTTPTVSPSVSTTPSPSKATSLTQTPSTSATPSASRTAAPTTTPTPTRSASSSATPSASNTPTLTGTPTPATLDAKSQYAEVANVFGVRSAIASVNGFRYQGLDMLHRLLQKLHDGETWFACEEGVEDVDMWNDTEMHNVQLKLYTSKLGLDDQLLKPVIAACKVFKNRNKHGREVTTEYRSTGSFAGRLAKLAELSKTVRLRPGQKATAKNKEQCRTIMRDFLEAQVRIAQRKLAEAKNKEQCQSKVDHLQEALELLAAKRNGLAFVQQFSFVSGADQWEELSSKVQNLCCALVKERLPRQREDTWKTIGQLFYGQAFLYLSSIGFATTKGDGLQPDADVGCMRLLDENGKHPMGGECSRIVSTDSLARLLEEHITEVSKLGLAKFKEEHREKLQAAETIKEQGARWAHNQEAEWSEGVLRKVDEVRELPEPLRARALAKCVSNSLRIVPRDSSRDRRDAEAAQNQGTTGERAASKGRKKAVPSRDRKGKAKVSDGSDSEDEQVKEALAMLDQATDKQTAVKAVHKWLKRQKD